MTLFYNSFLLILLLNTFLEHFLESAEDFLENFPGQKFNFEQKMSFLSIFKYNVNIIKGPAGTGKSEILIRLSKFIYNIPSISILFLTPTGKACDRLTKGFINKGLDISSYTIHKYNYYKYVENDNYDFKNPDFDNIIENHFKIFVIDEMSMISLNVFNTFINNISKLENCVLLLVGDTNQLPSIDCGDVLNHLVLSNSFNVVQLKEIFRSESKSLLVAQNNILNFKPLLDNIPNNDSSFLWIKDNPFNTDILLKILDDFDELPLLISSTNKVVDHFQNIIKNKYNRDTLNKDSILINKQLFHINDIIMIKKNDYDKQLMNGMVGKIISFKFVNKQIIGVNIIFDGENTPRNTFILDDLLNIDLAYIMTIHKSQGSESNYVIILLDNVSKLNTMNLLYTAITRSKFKCILIAQDNTINTIIDHKKLTKRISNLKNFC